MAKTALVDGSNVAFEELGEGDDPKVGNLVAMRAALEKRGYRPIILVDASLRHQVDDPQQLEAMIDEQVVLQVPAGTDADYFVLEMAQREDAIVVSNDQFRDYARRYPWIKERRVPYMIIDGDVVLYAPRLVDRDEASQPSLRGED